MFIVVAQCGPRYGTFVVRPYATADVFARSAMTRILQTWDIGAVDKAASPTFYSKYSRKRVRSLLADEHAYLGAFRKMTIMKSIKTRRETFATTTFYASYVMECRFTKRRASVFEVIEKPLGSNWRIVLFGIEKRGAERFFSTHLSKAPVLHSQLAMPSAKRVVAIPRP